MPERTQHVVGVMTGTSLDGIDAAYVRCAGEGLAISAELIDVRSAPLDDVLEPLRQLATGQPLTAEQIADCSIRFGELHADLIDELLANRPVDLICVHGQTIVHNPPVSWQMIEVAPIARRFPCPIVSGLRDADLAAGGEGAPITPIADWILFRHPSRSRAIINLGGFCNITHLPPANEPEDASLANLRGFDVCACNLLLNAVARLSLNHSFDPDGMHAAKGTPDKAALAKLNAILDADRRSGRSLGCADAAIAWADEYDDQLLADTLAATAVAAIGCCIGRCVDELQPDEIIIAGGGAHNRALVNAITSNCRAPRADHVELQIDVQHREPVAMAVLGCLCADGVPITLPHITHCHEPAPVAGVWHNVLPTPLPSGKGGSLQTQ